MTAGQPLTLDDRDPRQLGRFRVLGLLGEGGMSRVFLGCSANGQVVAIKVIRTVYAGDPEFRARFSHEAAAVAKVSGRYTAQVVDADTGGAVPWLAVAYVAGPSLAEASTAVGGPLPLPSVRRLGLGLAEALQAIHAAGVVHRDLKPSNVLLAADGPRVIDFGIARAAEGTQLTRTGMIVGSPGFMAPEQVTGAAVGPATDVFALGAVLAFAATGNCPFGEGRTEALAYRVVHGEPMLDDLPSSLREVVTACLAKDPRQRPDPSRVIASLTALPTAESQAGGSWIPDPVGGLIHQHQAVASAAITAWRESGSQPPPQPRAVLDPGIAATRADLRAGGHADPGPLHADPVPLPGMPVPRAGRRSRTPWVFAAMTAVVLVAVIAVLVVISRHPSPPARKTTLATTTTPSPAVTLSAAPAPPDPAVTVEMYYAAINSHDYARAWSLGGDTISAQDKQSYSQFVEGFAGTSHDSLVISSVDGDKVSITIGAEHSNGTVQQYQGYYIVQNGQIISARIS